MGRNGRACRGYRRLSCSSSSCDNLQSPGCPPLHHSLQVIVFDLSRATLRRMAPQKPLPAGSGDVPPALFRQLIDDLNALARPLADENLPSGPEEGLPAIPFIDHHPPTVRPPPPPSSSRTNHP